MPRLFIGNLGHDCRPKDIEKLFKAYGPVRNVNIKGKYGFVELDEAEDAEDAVQDLDGKSFNGGRIRIEFANAYSDEKRKGGSRERESRRDSSRERDGRRYSDGRFRKSDFRVIVEGLSSHTSWQDLKDFMGKAGEVVYTSVQRPRAGEGLVEFGDRKSMQYALKELDGERLDGYKISLRRENESSNSRSRSRSRSRRRKRSRSGSRRRGERRSRSRSPKRKGKRSRSRDSSKSSGRSSVRRSRSRS